MASAPPDRIQQLAARVGWLDRYRRAVSIAIAFVFCIAFERALASLFGQDWSGALTVVLSIFFSVFVWWIVEVAFAWLTAFWETEYVHLLRDNGLPVARLIRPRKARPTPGRE
jgi:hypothetical protein